MLISKRTMVRLYLIAAILAWGVVSLGAFVRLSDAGLGCPDWPGCYGHIGVPSETQDVAKATAAFPERPVEAHKAWKEMIHRYVAGTLGLLILLIAILSWVRRRDPEQATVLPWFLVGLVIFQALLGMWTVTLLLKPLVVVAHLLGGMTILALLWWLMLRMSGWLLKPSWVTLVNKVSHLRSLAIIAIAVVIVQIFLGGWTSANYAALACTDFPTCHGQWWPANMNFAEGFTFWHEIGKSYEFGIFSPEARTAVHVIHRVGALITFLVIAWLALRLFFANLNYPTAIKVAIVTMVLLLLQISLGTANVVHSLPLGVAVAHNAVASLLLLAVITFNHLLNPLNPIT